MVFDVAVSGLKCKHCRHQMAVPVPPGAAGAREIPLRDGYQRAPRGPGVATIPFGCHECGATLTGSPPDCTAAFPYCPSPSVGLL